MDYLERCYRANIRVFVDGVARILTVRWFWAPANAPVFPYSHCWGSQVYKDYLRWDEGGPIELDGKYQAPSDNPGYQAACFRGEREWWQSGNIPSAALLNPPPLPECCFVRPAHAIAGKASLHLCNISFAVNYPWIRTHPAVALESAGALGFELAAAPAAALALASAGYLLDGGRIVGKASAALGSGGRVRFGPYLKGRALIALNSPSGLVRRREIRGRAEMLLGSPSGQVHPQEVLGRAELLLGSSAELVLRQDLDGAAELLLGSSAELVYGPYLAGQAELLLGSSAELVYGPYLAGQANVAIVAAGQLVFAELLAGRASLLLTAGHGLLFIEVLRGGAALALTSGGALVASFSIAGIATMNLTATATLVFQPATGPGASCSASGSMTLGTTYGPFAQPASGVTDWWTWNAVSGTSYTITLNTGSTFGWMWSASQGSCPTPGTNLGLGGSSGGNLTVTAVSTGPAYVQVRRNIGTGASYTLKVA